MQHGIGRRSKQQPQAVLAVGAYDDQIRFAFRRKSAYLVGRRAKSHQGVIRLDAVLAG